MASNIPLGTYVSDGVRTGPFYSGQLPQGFVADINGVITSSSHDEHGPGILLSSQNTWKITPAAPAGVGVTTLNNLVGTTGIGAVVGARDLILLGDNSVTYLNGGVVQFDWPRVVTVTISGGDATANTKVTIFGTDWYGFPMQHTYVLAAPPATYPNINIGAGTITAPAATKAFYTVNRVFISAGLPGNSQISLGCADAFGLPYAISDEGSITSIGWSGSSDMTTLALGGSLEPRGIISPAVVDPATAITGDVRGFYVPSNAANGIPNVAGNYRSLSFTYYVHGADTWINQESNKQQLYMQKTGSATPQGMPIAPLNVNDLYGVPQFYTGSPS